jgi:hypothetical protein
LKKLVMLATMLALVMTASVPAVAQVSQQTGQESESGDVKLNFSVAGSGNSASQCAPIVQGSRLATCRTRKESPNTLRILEMLGPKVARDL